MHIKKVSIQNLRSIRHFEMEFEQPAGWHVLIGDNGSGKTTILRGMALAIMGLSEARSLPLNLREYVSRDKSEANLYVDLKLHDPGDIAIILSTKIKCEFGLIIKKEGIYNDGEYIDIHPSYHNTVTKNYGHKSFGITQKQYGFSASFGPFRRFTGGNPHWEKIAEANPRAAPHFSLLGEDVALSENLDWLVNLNYKRLEGDEEAKEILTHLKTFINDGELLPHGAKISIISSSGVYLTDVNGKEVSINDMSDGFRSILSMTFEIIRQMVLNPIYGRKVFDSIQKGEIKINVPGVVMIDEVDAHLHPTWQTEIGFWFTKYFPNIQFIVTTHSPLVCRACERGSIWRLAAPGSGEESREITGTDKERLIIGNILDAYGTDLFGQSPVRSRKSDEKRKRLGQLNILHALGKIEDTEEKERLKLQRILTTDDPTGF